MKLKHTLALAAAVCLAPFTSAQLVLQDFSAFQSPDTFFVGDWAQSEPSGDLNPTASFSQGLGVYNFAGGSNSDLSGAYYFFTPGDLSGFNALALSAKLLSGNAAPTFTVSLFSGAESAFAVFSTGSFSADSFTTVAAALTYTPGFDPTAVDSLLISGGSVGGSDLLSFSADNLAAVAVPEPSTYGLIAAAALLGLVALKRRKVAQS